MDGFADQVGNFLFEDIERGVDGLVLLLLRLGFGERLAVHLLVHVERNLVDLHRDGRHHVRRFAFQDEGIQFLDLDGLFCHDVGGQVLAATGALFVESLYGGIGDAGIFEDDGFDLFKLDTETADLDL